MSNPQFTFRQTTFTHPSLILTRRTTICRTTLHTQLAQLRANGQYDCFKLKWHPIFDDNSRWPAPLHLFWDSDVGKWIEGACYFLADTYDAEIDFAVRDLVEMIRSAQHDDGYINVHFSVVEPGKRWTNIRDMHEMYNAGHLIEAALAHRAYYKNDRLMDPLNRYITHIRARFGPDAGQLRAYPGHPEIELALLRVYSATGNRDAYDLARFFLGERGNPAGQAGQHFYDWEAEQRDEPRWKRPNSWPMDRSFWYCQAHAPILEQETVEGHAVRAMYLLTAAADLLNLSNEIKPSAAEAAVALAKADEWLAALRRLWSNMVHRKMYLTGGVGAVAQWEGFGIDYFLPQGPDEGGGYAETCASVGVMMLAERLLHADPVLNGEYGDVMELCLYNNVMTAMSADGKAFTYENQLASCDTARSEREDWFVCACCPPNVTRLFGSLGGYLWDYGALGEEGGVYVNVHLYTSAEVKFAACGREVRFEQKSNWPWEGRVEFRIKGAEGLDATVRLRIPAWAKGQYELMPSPRPGECTFDTGYIHLGPTYIAEHPSFSLDVHGFEPRFVAPHPYTNQRTLSLARGPVVYCVEDADNEWEENHFRDIGIKAGERVEDVWRDDRIRGEKYVALKTRGWQRSPEVLQGGGDGVGRELVFVPFYFRSNRGGKGQMRVGLRDDGR
ncbi:Non-reducing end beta-L-arabinofuranosidase [Colletotrichum orbiculare MAFF 240422]|uniref:Non-reducing end beta-L-arabinofuranosidase n=1 Tax=Colletotrichum orbiculare (strain 104-T / ATCC 96160 / CBS 514.97 / LARS 414 / MAFF 240422) TaxID=1213857 RepID=N4VL64_COLOR|nr:Non-reducing end beta-L-arabinofuranosidase [Colletotrichum orbiculare MAFF 240422]